MNHPEGSGEKFEVLHLPGLAPDDEIVAKKPLVEDEKPPLEAAAEPELSPEEEREYERQDSQGRSNAYTIREQARRSGKRITAHTTTLGTVETRRVAKSSSKSSPKKTRYYRGRGETTTAEDGFWSDLG